MKNQLVIYGATGYTGKLMVEMAVAQGLKPLISGRNEQKLSELGEQFGLDHRAVSLDDEDGLSALLADAQLVLHIAGPFSATAQPMVKACLATKTHYLDITGEIEIFEHHYTLNSAAKEAGIMIMSGVGFDVVPTDCLAAHLKNRLADASQLEISIAAGGALSPGTAKTGVESIHKKTIVRRGGQLNELGKALFSRTDFGRGERPTIAMSWGDVSTAYRTTGIPDITVYFKLSTAIKKIMSIPGWVRSLMGNSIVQRIVKWQIEKRISGPTAEQRAATTSSIVAEATNANGEKVRSILTTPEGYTLTCMTSLEIVARVMQGDAQPGFQTPAGLFGADFILPFEGVERKDVA